MIVVATALSIAVGAGAMRSLSGRASREHARRDGPRQWLARGSDSLDASLARLGAAVEASSNAGVDAGETERRLRLAFIDARARFKHIEGVVEFYAPAIAASLNSRRQEVDDDDAPPPSALAPGGFPALEPLVWPAISRDSAEKVRVLIAGMRRVVARVRALSAALVPTDAQLIELARLEVARVSTLGIAGFDAPLTHASMREAADALDGVRQLYADAGPAWWPSLQPERGAVDSAFRRAADHLRAHPEFDSFDRLAFIVAYAEPAARAIDSLRRAAGTTAVRIPRAWRADIASVYDAGAFDPRAYAPSDAPVSTAAAVALGERLFAEPTLSGSGTRSCASCHSPSHAFTDGLARAARIDGHGLVARHTPTLLNAALAPAQFADERAPTLEEQVARVLESPTEMASSTERATGAVAHRNGYAAQFARAFGGAADTAVTPTRLRFALAAFERSLVALDSRFDRAVRGDTSLLSARERRGFTLFMGKAGCGTCHFAPLFNGNTPPLYRGSDVEVIGTPISPTRPGLADPDSGRARIDHLPTHVRAFKTPTVRNSTLTAPYMHNGAFASLEQVIGFYDHGGGAGAGARITNQTLSSDSLHLTGAERAAIIAFLGTLTDTVLTRR
jgi:cytochrome c peroxidase